MPLGSSNDNVITTPANLFHKEFAMTVFDSDKENKDSLSSCKVPGKTFLLFINMYFFLSSLLKFLHFACIIYFVYVDAVPSTSKNDCINSPSLFSKPIKKLSEKGSIYHGRKHCVSQHLPSRSETISRK